MAKFSVVGLLMAYQTDPILESYHAVAKHLLDLGLEVLIDQDSIAVVGANAVVLNQLLNRSECIVVVGGDGSLLSVAAKVVQYDKPLIGINRGHLGFLSDINPAQLKELTAMMAGHYQQEQRSLISVTMNDGQQEFLALNEVVLSRTDQVRLLQFEVYIDQRFVCFQRADGLIVSTPTGSTAYALSAGGAIVQPGLNAVTLVPLNPHRLNSRPIVIRNDQTIDLHILQGSQGNASLSADGMSLATDSVLKKATLTKANQQLTLLHPPHYDYFETLKAKLHWERKEYAHQY